MANALNQIGRQFTRQLSSTDLFAPTRILARPQRRKVTASKFFRRCT